MAKWRDRAWKYILCGDAKSAIEYLMPDLAADMDRTKEISSVSGMELFSEGSDSDRYMRENDVFYNIPMLDGETGNVAMFTEQQHDPADDIAERVFQTYIRLREKWRLPTTCIVLYTGSAPNVNTYVEGCYGFKVSVEFRSYCLPEKSAEELRADKHPFARIMQAARLSWLAKGNPKLREKYAEEVLKTAAEQNYDNEKKFFILNFIKKIFRLNAPDISDGVRRDYDMQMVPIKEYAEKIAREHERLDALEEVAMTMLADGMTLEQAAKYTRLPIEDLQDLIEDMQELKPH